MHAVGLSGAHSKIAVRDKIAPRNCLPRWERAVAAVLRLVFLALMGMGQFSEAQQTRTFQFVLLQFPEFMHTLGGPSGGWPRSTGAMRGHCLRLQNICFILHMARWRGDGCVWGPGQGGLPPVSGAGRGGSCDPWDIKPTLLCCPVTAKTAEGCRGSR